MLRTALTALTGLALFAAACGSPDSPDAGNPLDLGRDSEQQQCIQNLYEICTAQSMHYAIYNVYMTSIPEVYEFMGDELACPSCGQYYIMIGDEEEYTVSCPLTQEPNHGTYGSQNIPPNPHGSEVDVCRSNMLTLRTIESMYYGVYNCFTDSWENIRESGIYTGPALTCPGCGSDYRFHAQGSHYCIRCPLPADPIHGSVVDAMISW